MDLNETYDYLLQVRRTTNAILRKTGEQNALRESLYPGAIRYDRVIVKGSAVDKMADVEDRIEALEAEIQALCRRKADQIALLRAAIDMLPDDTEATVLSEFYIARRPMVQIADHISYSVRRAYQIREKGVLHLGQLLS